MKLAEDTFNSVFEQMKLFYEVQSWLTRQSSH